MKFLCLTNLGDRPVYVSPDAIALVREAVRGEYEADCGSVIELINGLHVAVREKPEEIIK